MLLINLLQNYYDNLYLYSNSNLNQLKINLLRESVILDFVLNLRYKIVLFFDKLRLLIKNNQNNY